MSDGPIVCTLLVSSIVIAVFVTWLIVRVERAERRIRLLEIMFNECVARLAGRVK